MQSGCGPKDKLERKIGVWMATDPTASGMKAKDASPTWATAAQWVVAGVGAFDVEASVRGTCSGLHSNLGMLVTEVAIGCAAKYVPIKCPLYLAMQMGVCASLTLVAPSCGLYSKLRSCGAAPTGGVWTMQISGCKPPIRPNNMFLALMSTVVSSSLLGR